MLMVPSGMQAASRLTSRARAGLSTTFTRWCRRVAQTTRIAFVDISSCCGHCHATPDSLRHGGMHAACRKLLFALIGRPGQEEIATKDCSPYAS